MKVGLKRTVSLLNLNREHWVRSAPGVPGRLRFYVKRQYVAGMRYNVFSRKTLWFEKRWLAVCDWKEEKSTKGRPKQFILVNGIFLFSALEDLYCGLKLKILLQESSLKSQAWYKRYSKQGSAASPKIYFQRSVIISTGLSPNLVEHFHNLLKNHCQFQM